MLFLLKTIAQPINHRIFASVKETKAFSIGII
jgi:hypothetical protein